MILNPLSLVEWNTDILAFQQPEKYKDNLKSFIENPITFRVSKQVLTEKIHCSGSWYYIDIEIQDDTTLSNFFKSLDEYIIETVYSNRSEWFNQDIPKEMIRSFYEPCLRCDKTLRVKVPAINKVPDVQVYSLSLFEKDEDVPPQDNVSSRVSSLELYENKPVSFLIDISSLRFLKNKCSCEFKLNFVSVRDVDIRTMISSDDDVSRDDEKEMKRIQHHQLIMEAKKSVEEQLEELVKKQVELKEKYDLVMEEEKKLLSSDIIDENFELTFYNRIAI